jgi:hypothetical protein
MTVTLRESLHRTRVRARHSIGVALVAALVLVPVTGSPAGAAQSGQPPAWLTHYDSADGSMGGGQLEVSPDGNRVAFVGIAPGTDGRDGFTTIVYDATTGAAQWTVHAGPSGTSAGNYLYSADLAWTPDGQNVIVTGTSATAHGTVAVVVAYDAATGSVVWSARDDLAGFYTGGVTLAVTPDGAKVIALERRVGKGSNGDLDYWLVAYDTATGAPQWTRAVGYRQLDDRAESLSISPDGSFVVIGGETVDTVTGTDFLLAAVSTADGAVRWRVRTGLLGVFAYAGNARVLVAPDGNRVFLTGTTSWTFPGRSWYVEAFDTAAGAPLWTQRPLQGDSNTTYTGYNAAVTADGTTLFVTGGIATDQITNGDVVLLALDTANGTQRWSAKYNGPVSRNDRGVAVAVTPDDATVVVTGISGGVLQGASLVSDDDITLAYNATTGAPQWTARYDEKQEDIVSAIGIASGGANAVITSVSWKGGRNADYAVIAYPIAAA